jgi:hypothetical protein
MTRFMWLTLLAVGCGPPSSTSPITVGAVTIDPLKSFSAVPTVTDENACIEQPVLVVTNQALECDEYAAATEGIFVLEGENRFILKFDRGALDDVRGKYEVLGGLEGPPERQLFASADVEGINWRGFNGNAEVFSFDDSGAAVSYSLELEQRTIDGARASVGGGVVAEHCQALQDAFVRCQP